MNTPIGLKFILLVAGGITAIVGICIGSWKVTGVGNTIGLASLLF